ncbi:mitochondrial K+-H+ exchange-related-domain-containing protein [Kalaharituber pfeilii]|nr:mitochondrial K+-H+ exchange-related-domain-containing protein [Kalaharituber pfeilii]
MKLFLIPITKRRTLVYAKQLSNAALAKPSLVDRISVKASATWQQWVRGDKRWQRSLVEAGNKLLRRIPYEEWGLKSISTLSVRRRDAELQDVQIPVVFPATIISPEKVPSIIQRLATERTTLHRSRLWWSVIGMPIVAPFALVPVIPNIPFFYLAFRAYSHWKALAGGKHLEFLVKNNLLVAAPSQQLSEIYSRNSHSTEMKPHDTQYEGKINDPASEAEVVLIDENDARKIASVVDVPELAGELERAQEQVRKKLSETNRQTKPKRVL